MGGTNPDFISQVSLFHSDKSAGGRCQETMTLQSRALAFLITTQLIHYLTILPKGWACPGHGAQSCDCKIREDKYGGFEI